ncbi:MAG: universal bacterial protein YeaZ [Planctomycetota bacterium]|nr:universal bacterial protein YeaZ [Planctomycetota bacterium]
MNLLALDTSTLCAAVALERGDGERFVAPVDASRRHGRELLPAIRGLLRDAGIRPGELGAIGVGLGPGSYTGLRVGVTAAKTLAYATGARLVGLDSLEFFARSAPIEALRVAAISDAQRGDLHVGDFARIEAGSPLLRSGPTRIESLEVLATSWVPPLVVVGPGVARWDSPWPAGVEPIDRHDPDPRLLLDLLKDAVAANRRDDPWFLEPIYVRRSAAEDQWESKKSR